MDEGKDSLGTTRAQNADGFDASAQSSAQSVDSTTSSDPPADNKIISSANLTPPTPLSAPLPTDPLHPIQTVGTGSGDVILGKQGVDKKNILVIGIIVAIVLFVILIMLLPVLLKDNNGDASQLLRQNFDTISSTEDFFEKVYFREITTDDIMTPEDYEQINQNISQFLSFQKDFAKINPDKLDDEIKIIYENLQSRAETYQKSLELYNTVYSAYTEEKPELLNDYLASEEYSVAAIAERFVEYFNDRDRLLEQISANDCAIDGNNSSEICIELVNNYRDTIESMRQSYSVPQSIFFAYDAEPDYQDESSLISRVEQVIKETEE